MKAGFLLGAVALAVAAGYTVRELKTERVAERRRESEGRLFNAAPEDVTAVSVARPDGTVSIERGPDGWRLVAPAASRTDNEAVGEVLRLVSGASTTRTIEAAPAAPERYGLGSAATRVGVTTRSGERQEVEVGLEAPTEEGVYIRRPGNSAVLLADADMRDLSQVDGRLLAERTLLPAASAAVRVDIRGVKGSTILQIKNGAWYVSEPFQFPADRTRVTSLLDAFGSAKRQPPPQQPSPEAAGLEPPRVEVVFYDPQGAQTTFHFGIKEGEKTMWAAAGKEPAFLVPSSLDEVLRELPEDWSEKRPAAVDRYKATRIALRLEDRVLQAQKGPSGWTDAKGRALPEAQVLALLAALCDTPGELISRELRNARVHPSLSAEVEEEGGRRQVIEGFGPQPDGSWLLRPRGFHPLLKMPPSVVQGVRQRLDAIQGVAGPANQ